MSLVGSWRGTGRRQMLLGVVIAVLLFDVVKEPRQQRETDMGVHT